MSTDSLWLTAALALLFSATQVAAAPDATPAAMPAAQSEELRQLRERVVSLEATLSSTLGLRERLATLEGQLKGYEKYTDHVEKLVDASIKSSDKSREMSDKIRDYVTYFVSFVVALFGIGGGLFWIQLKSLRDKARSETDELHVATQIARAVGDLLRGDQAQKDEMKKVWWTSAYQKLSHAQEKGINDPDWLNWRAYTLKRLKDVDEALNMSRKAAKKAAPRSPQRARALYNVACYSALLGHKLEALGALREAVRAESLYRAVAAVDTDFDCILKDTELCDKFRDIIHP